MDHERHELTTKGIYELTTHRKNMDTTHDRSEI